MARKIINTTRRGFLKTVAAIGTGAVIDRSGAQAANTQTKASPDKWIVPKRPFGDTGVQVPILSLGGMFNTGRNLLLLKQAVKWGVTYWDTAARYEYWGSETGIGKYFTRYPEDRKKIFLVSKAYSLDPSRLDQYLDASLDNLKTDYIDL
ncbi:Ferredoxin [Olavius algarvensis Delta 1 endosymbiont]|nr:Ferredoxin [Olavius algarvensis Delta 1 endosymbiont]